MTVTYTDPQYLTASRELLLELGAEFVDAAIETEISLAKAREVDSLRRRAALRLVPVAKLGFEHLALAPSAD